ncbi:hypothetical protein TorRG33x02_046510, partial [Trema orientale]
GSWCGNEPSLLLGELVALEDRLRPVLLRLITLKKLLVYARLSWF